MLSWGRGGVKFVNCRSMLTHPLPGPTPRVMVVNAWHGHRFKEAVARCTARWPACWVRVRGTEDEEDGS